jgi:hypothetical protein
MKKKHVLPSLALAALVAGCATTPEQPARPSTPVDAVQKVIATLATEIAARRGTDAFRGLPVVVQPAGNGIEPMVAELLRTRLVEHGVAVDHACAPRCMEVTLTEFSGELPQGSMVTPGQVLGVVSGAIPVVGGLVRSYSEQEKEKQRAARRTSGLFITYAARDGNRYTARANAVAITSAGNGEVAVQNK